MRKGQTCTIETKKKMSISAKRAGTGKWSRPHTEETKQKLRLLNLGKNNPMYGRPSTQLQKETARKTMLGNKFRLGSKMSEEEKEERSIKFSGKGNPFYGKTHTQKVRDNVSKAVSSRIGELHPLWIKDRTKLSRTNKQGERRTSAYFFWRKQVWLRDKFTCKIANPDCKGRIEAHHILGFTENPKLRYDINNGITLCHFHHPRKRSEEAKLSPLFQQLVSEK